MFAEVSLSFLALCAPPKASLSPSVYNRGARRYKSPAAASPCINIHTHAECEKAKRTFPYIYLYAEHGMQSAVCGGWWVASRAAF